MSRIALLLLVAVISALPQTPAQKKTTRPKPRAAKPVTPAPPPAPQVFRVESIAVQGNKLYTPEQIIAASGLKLQEPGDKERFDLARNRLLDTGAFATVGYRYAPSADGKGYAVTFEVAEIEQVFPIRFDELSAPAAELREVLRKADPLFGEKVPGTEAALKRYVAVLEQHLGGQDLSARVTSEGPGELFILIRPAGAPMNVAQVTFTGNKAIQSLVLQNTIAGVAVGVPYNEKRFRLLLDTNIRPLYDARGLIRVQFPRIAVEKAKDVTGYAVTVEVAEGPVYNLGDVAVEGVTSKDQLYKTAGFKPGTVANFDQINEGIGRMKKWLRARGYMNPQLSTERNIDDAKRLVNLKIAVVPGPVYKFGKLLINGLDIIGEPAVRKLWAIKTEQPFNADYPAYFLDRLRQDGVFDNLGKTKYELKIDEQKQVVDVILYFAGQEREEKKKAF